MADDDRPDIETTGTRLVYENRWMRLREDAIRRRDGSPGIYGVVEKPDFVIVAAVDEGGIHLVEQFRYPVGARFWELPQGTWEMRPDATPEEVARRELREETGLEAATFSHVGHFFQSYGFSTQGCHVFLATGLTQGASAREPEEQDLVARRFPLDEVERMLRHGAIKDSSTLAAFGLMRLKRLL